jgi:hypothetical protein
MFDERLSVPPEPSTVKCGMHSRADVRGYPGSYALLSSDSRAKTAIVFVHGFAGNSVTTWLDFHTRVDDEPHAARYTSSDLYFYSYDSTGTDVESSAIRLGNFVADVGVGVDISTFRYWFKERTVNVDSTAMQELDSMSRAYEKLVFVAHSLGAVIVRRTVLNCVEKSRKFTPQVSQRLQHATLVLFAPAQYGFRHDLLVSTFVSVSKFLQIGAAALMLTCGKVYADVLQGSNTLKILEQHTSAELAKHSFSGLMATIYWGLPDDVVMVGGYLGDSEVKKSHLGHVAICKPVPGFLDPLSWVADAID